MTQTPRDARPPVATREATIDAHIVVLEQLDVDLQVRVGDAGTVSVQVTGTRDAVDALAIEHEVGPPSVVRIGGCAELHDRVDVKLTVPEHCAVRLAEITGNADIGDTHGPLGLRLGDSATVHAGQVADTDVVIVGDSSVTVGHVDAQHLTVTIAGWGNFRASADVERFTADVVGRGGICLAGAASHADLTVRGDGHISAGRVRSTLRRSIVGSGNISVPNPPRTDVAASYPELAQTI